MYALKGNIIYAAECGALTTIKNGYVGVDGEHVAFVSETLPDAYQDIRVDDYGDRLIIPGFCDLHTHAPQFENIGLGMNLQLLPWLNELTFPTEAKYHDRAYAEEKYAHVIEELYRFGTTRAVLFTTIHVDTAQILVEMMEAAGFCGYVGKVNMDSNCPELLCEDTKVSLEQTRAFYERNKDNKNIKPILTPRFVPTSSREMLKGLGELASEYQAPIQSHINENLDEIRWVEELFPEADHYADVYDRYGLFTDRTLMAHCIHMKPEEIELMADRGVYAVHCPHSNVNLASGIMPLKVMMDKGVKVGFGSDVSGGNAVNIAEIIVLAMQVSKLRYQRHPEEGFLSFAEAFYIATKGGGSFFGKVGSFETGYEFDALVIDDKNLGNNDALDITERLSRFVYKGDDRNIVYRYIKGKMLTPPK